MGDGARAKRCRQTGEPRGRRRRRHSTSRNRRGPPGIGEAAMAGDHFEAADEEQYGQTLWLDERGGLAGVLRDSLEHGRDRKTLPRRELLQQCVSAAALMTMGTMDREVIGIEDRKSRRLNSSHLGNSY